MSVMEFPENPAVNLQRFFVPFCLFSVALFSFYPFVLVVLLSGFLEPGLGSLFPVSTAKQLAGISYLIMLEICYIMSFTGSLLIIREMKSQSMSWKYGLPLCMISIVLLFSIIQLPFPPDPSTSPAVFISISDIGLGLLPFGIFYAFKTFKESRIVSSDIDMIQSSCTIVGIIGVVFLCFLLNESISAFSTPVSCDGDCFNPWGALILLFFALAGPIIRLVFWMLLLPFLGIKILKFFTMQDQPKSS